MRWCGSVVLVMLTFAGALGQQTRGSRTQEAEEMLSNYDKAKLSGGVQPEGVALESTIDPLNYFVGPSDIIAVNIWTSPPLSFTLTVTPEGTLIIPTVGEARVSDLSLAKVKEDVRKMIQTRYRGSTDPSVTLLRPRPIVVTVTGNVLNPGSFVLAAHYRADKAVGEANIMQVTQTPQDLTRTLATMSRRNISIRHKDGTQSNADMIKFQATKEDRWNPYLREGDVIVVPRRDLLRSVIGVYGEVNSPGRYEFVRGDSIKDALKIAQGFTSLALVDSIEFSRLSEDGDQMVSSFFDGRDLFSGKIPDTALEPGDRVVVRARPDLRADYRVIVMGEVLYPGTYPITKSKTHLSSIIKAAGGFTEFASIKTAELIRQSIDPNAIRLERLESARGGVTPDDSLYYYLETELRINKENVSADFERLFVQGDSTEDVILRDGDIIRVPARNNTIYVFGQVADPGHVPFVDGEGTDFYIDQAGGFTERARKGDLKIVKAKTRQWLSPEETTIEEGDYVWVPKEIEHSFAYYMAIIGQTASIVSVALSVVILALQISEN